MRLPQPLLKLPLLFDADALIADVKALPRLAWVPHPDRIAGNDAVRLISPNGGATDLWDGHMAPTEHLLSSPYIREIMKEIGAVWGRSRLMGLAAGSTVPAHIDSHYYWRTHVRIHIPIITNPDVSFTVAGETVHMKAGECWTFDSFQRHEVLNGGSEHRVHLVLDTVGGGKLWELIRAADEGQPPRLVKPGQARGGPLQFERVNSPKVMSPWEMRCHVRFLTDEARPHPALGRVLDRLEQLMFEWGAVWANSGDADQGLPAYRALLAGADADLGRLDGQGILLKNDVPFYHALGRLLFEVALAPVKAVPPPARSGFVTTRRLAS